MVSNISESDSLIHFRENFEAIVDQLSDALILIDESAAIVACSAAASKFLQSPRNEIIGKGLNHFTDLEQSDLQNLYSQCVVSRSPTLLRFKFLSPQNNKPSKAMISGFRYEVSLQKIPALVAIKIDTKHVINKKFSLLNSELLHQQKLVNDLRQKQAELSEKNRDLQFYSSQMNAVFEAAISGIIIIDHKGLIQRFSPSAERIFGWREDEVVGRNVTVLMYDDLASEHDGYLQHFLLTGKTSIIGKGREITAKHKSGRSIEAFLAVAHVNHDNNEGLFIGYIRDLTDIKHAESELQINKLKLDAVIESSQDGIWDMDVPSGKTELSDIIYVLTGYVKEQVVSELNFFQQLVHPDDWPRVEEHRMLCLQDKQAYRDVEYRIVSQRGDIHWVSDSGKIIERDEAGNPLRMVGAIKVITQRKKLEQEMLKMTNEAEQANIAKGVFVANMSHEIRTPLNTIIGYLQLMRTTSLSDKQLKHVNNADRSSHYLLSLLNEILDYSKIQANMLELELLPFSLYRCASRIYDNLNNKAADKLLVLDISVAPDCTDLIIGDQKRLTQILLNLGDNAIKFTDDGKVSIHISMAHPQPQHNDDAKVKLHFAVMDTGIGIESDHQSKIFEQFSQAETSTSRIYGGSGLGLSIVKELLQLMGGQINIESTPGKGSCFSFELEFERAAEEQLGLADQALSADVTLFSKNRQPLNGCRLLSVDDNPLNQQLMDEALTLMGASVDLAADGVEAISKITSNDNDYDLVLMDLQMPNMDGIECARQLHEVHHLVDLPIIGVSATIQAREKRACLEVGMNDCLSKPISFAKLEKVVSDLCIVRRDTNPADQQNAIDHVIDQEGALERLDGNQGIYNRLVQRFLEDIDSNLSRLYAYMEDASPEAKTEARKLLHLLDGSALTLGAVRLSKCIREVQAEFKSDKNVKPDHLISKLDEEFIRAIQSLKDIPVN